MTKLKKNFNNSTNSSYFVGTLCKLDSYYGHKQFELAESTYYQYNKKSIKYCLEETDFAIILQFNKLNALIITSKGYIGYIPRSILKILL